MNDVERITTLLASVFALGIGAQCIAWRARVPAILLLILAGLAAGPMTGYLDPDKLLGPLLSPIVSLSVAIILFEGGLNLRLRELAGTGTALIGLLTVGVAITATVSAALAYWILDMPASVAILLGSILVVTGPTVLGPLLRQIRPSGKVGSVARWEGVVIDPIGATLAVLVFEVETVIGTTNYESVFAATAMGLATTTFVGVSIGLAMAAMMLLLLRFFLVSDHLQGGVALACVLAAFAVAELFKNEAGLLAVTVMGLMLANQKKVRIDTIAEFKENLSVILISCLFILLAARVRMDHLLDVGWKGLLFVASMIVVVRPLSVFASTMGSGLNIRERLFLAWLAPRGIVAAAVSSVFAIELGEKAGSMASVAFLVILGTVAIYGVTSGLVARALGLATKDAQGFLVAGANPLACAIAQELRKQEIPVVLVDTQFDGTRRARELGLPVFYASILSEFVFDNVDFRDLGRFLALTPNDEVNALASHRFRSVFGGRNIFQLAAAGGSARKQNDLDRHAGRTLFGEKWNYEELDNRLRRGATIKVTPITEAFSLDDFLQKNGDRAVPMFVLQNRRATVCTQDMRTVAKPGQSILSLVFTDTEPTLEP